MLILAITRSRLFGARLKYIETNVDFCFSFMIMGKPVLKMLTGFDTFS